MNTFFLGVVLMVVPAQSFAATIKVEELQLGQTTSTQGLRTAGKVSGITAGVGIGGVAAIEGAAALSATAAGLLYGGPAIIMAGAGVVGFVAAVAIGLVIGVKELVNYFREHSGLVNATLFGADVRVSFWSELCPRDIHGRVYPYGRRDLGSYKMTQPRGGCIPKKFVVDLMVPTNGITVALHREKKNKISGKDGGKKAYGFGLKEVGSGYDKKLVVGLEEIE